MRGGRLFGLLVRFRLESGRPWFDSHFRRGSFSRPNQGPYAPVTSKVSAPTFHHRHSTNRESRVHFRSSEDVTLNLLHRSTVRSEFRKYRSTSVVQTSHIGFTSEVSDYLVVHTGPYQCLFVCWLLNVPATCECISGTDLNRQFYVLPH